MKIRNALKFNITWISYLLLIVFVSCKGGASKFAALDVADATKNISTPLAITTSIKSFSPQGDPIRLGSSVVSTFGVTLAESDSTVNYTFLLDGSTTLQEGANSYYNLSTTGRSAGAHSLKVTASNSSSSDSHTFNIIINSPTSIISSTPAITGTSLSCGGGSQSLTGIYADADTSDNVAVKWYLNDSQISLGSTTASITNDAATNSTLLNFHPDCTQVGINFIKLELNDGRDITTRTWAISVYAPIIIHIADWIPLTDPVVLTASSSATFGVNLTTPDGNAVYNFILDNAIQVQNDNRTYTSISGASLITAGAHTLKVIASNANSNDTHIFNIRKNVPPTISSSSPAAAGTIVDCGSAPITLSADMADANSDSLSYTWSVDDNTSPYLSPSSSGNHTQATFNPSCLISGTRVVKAVVSDGYESTTVSWSVTVKPAAAVTVGSFTPTSVPTVITSAQKITFGIILTATNSEIAYTYSIKNLSTGLSSSLYTGSSPYYELDGSTLNAGSYELKGRASNGTYSDEHIFVVRKNSPPAVPPTPLTFSPAIAGTTIICGSGSQLFKSAIADADLDFMNITWKLDGATGAASLVNSSNTSEAKATYTPSCAEVGIKTISVDVSDGFETTTKTWTVNVVTPIIISISSVTPTGASINLASASTTTFGVTLATADPSANYRFVLDGTQLQNGASSFYDLSTAALAIVPGAHTLVVTASNATSSDSYSFNIIVNIPTAIGLFSPNLNDLSLSCGLTNANISAPYSDANAADTVSVKWYLNDTLVAANNANVNLLNDPSNKLAQINYHPTCAQAGINFIKLELFDGHEYTIQTWTVAVTAPITIRISEFLPASDPTILTGSTSATFGVTLANPDSSANYIFVLDNTLTLQNGRKTYYNLAGSGIGVGTHTLAVTASNATSSDTKTFNIRKNSPPSYTAFSPAFTGTTVNCGATPITLYADMVDANGDTLTYQWLVDDAPSAYVTPSNSGNRVQASFNPTCAITGSRVIKAIVSDGNESVSISWNISIAAPITIRITGFIPATNPTILKATDNVPFSVALAAADANINYNFALKNLSTNTTTTLQSGATPFYNLVASTLSGGLYELTVTASNGTSSDAKVFSLRKNSPPSLPPAGMSFSPAATGVILSCGASSQILQSSIADSDSDNMAITWTLNGSANAASLNNSNSATLARATYTPTCLEVGTQTIKVQVFDGYETSERTWAVTVINPTVVNILSYSPIYDPASVLSTGSQVFSVSASGKAPIVYEWRLDGTILPAFTSSFANMTAGMFTTGAHTLVVRVSDSDSNASRTFNIIKNAPPVLAAQTPVSTSLKINVKTVTQFSASFSDANSDTLTATWFINGSQILAGDSKASIVSTGTTSQLVFTPSVDRLGNNTIALQVSDGKETATQTWSVNINYFSDACNNMGAGKICTVAGSPGRSSGIVVANDPSRPAIRPVFMEFYANASGVKNGSYFFTDDSQHVVWFYNKSATSITMFGQSIGPGVLKAILGVGLLGSGTSGKKWDDFPLRNPRGVAWDYPNQRLFVSDEGNNRVVMLSNSGIVTTILNNSIGNTAIGNGNNANALTGSWCQTPRGLQYNPATKLLYVACYNSFTVRSVDTTNANSALWTSSIVSGSWSNGLNYAASDDGTNGYLGSNRFYYPTTLKLDTANNVLYVSDVGHCKIKAINMSGTSKSYFGGAYTIAAGSTGTIFGMTGTAPTYGTNASRCGGNFTTGGNMSNGVISLAPPANGFATAQVNGGNSNGAVMSMELNMSGSTLLGFFVSDTNHHRIGYVNNTASSVTIGNSIVPSYSMNVVWGGNGNIPGGGSTGFTECTTKAAGNACYLWNPSTMNIYTNPDTSKTLYLADYNNTRIRTLNISVDNGDVTNDVGYLAKYGFAGNGGVSTDGIQFSKPINLYFDPNSGKLIISDFLNYRFRSLNLNTGRIDSFIGNGAGDASIAQIDPSAVGLRGPRAIVNYNNFMLYADTQNSNCVVRAWNTLASIQTIFGVTTYTNAIQTIAGNFINGCGAWDPLAITGTHDKARLNNPQGIATDGVNLYIANTSSHCILKVDQNGNMSTFAGTCGTAEIATTTPAPPTSGLNIADPAVLFTNPVAVVVDPRYSSYGNLFILDKPAGVSPRIRYINQRTTAVTIGTQSVQPGQILTVYVLNGDNYPADLASFDNQICASTGGALIGGSNSGEANNSFNNVWCFNRDVFGSNTSIIIGRQLGYDSRGFMQEDQAEEGFAAQPSTINDPPISLAAPAGLAFDSNGSLYIAERDGHDIRKVTKWW